MEHPLTHERLKELFWYNPETGLFTRLIETSLTTYVGQITAGWKHPQGHLLITIDYKPYLAHRLAWFYMTGVWPDKHIEHIDGIKSNNCFLNLQLASVRKRTPQTGTGCT